MERRQAERRQKKGPKEQNLGALRPRRRQQEEHRPEKEQAKEQRIGTKPQTAPARLENSAAWWEERHHRQEGAEKWRNLMVKEAEVEDPPTQPEKPEEEQRRDLAEA